MSEVLSKGGQGQPLPRRRSDHVDVEVGHVKPVPRGLGCGGRDAGRRHRCTGRIFDVASKSVHELQIVGEPVAQRLSTGHTFRLRSCACVFHFCV